MAESKTISCKYCGSKNPGPLADNRCRECGAKTDEAPPPPSSRHDELAAAHYQQGFSLPWCGISVAIVSILTASIVMGLPIVIPAFDFEGSTGMMLAIPIWFLSGMLVGLISPGRTVAEPVVATFLVAMPTAFFLFEGQTVKTLPAFMYVLVSALGVLFSLIGSYAGERVQMGPAPRRQYD